MTQATCADLVVDQWERTRKALKAFQNDKLTNEEECTLYEYGCHSTSWNLTPLTTNLSDTGDTKCLGAVPLTKSGIT